MDLEVLKLLKLGQIYENLVQNIIKINKQLKNCQGDTEIEKKMLKNIWTN